MIKHDHGKCKSYKAHDIFERHRDLRKAAARKLGFLTKARRRSPGCHAVDSDPDDCLAFLLPLTFTVVIFLHRSAALAGSKKMKRPAMSGVDQSQTRT